MAPPQLLDIVSNSLDSIIYDFTKKHIVYHPENTVLLSDFISIFKEWLVSEQFLNKSGVDQMETEIREKLIKLYNLSNTDDKIPNLEINMSEIFTPRSEFYDYITTATTAANNCKENVEVLYTVFKSFVYECNKTKTTVKKNEFISFLRNIGYLYVEPNVYGLQLTFIDG